MADLANKLYEATAKGRNTLLDFKTKLLQAQADRSATLQNYLLQKSLTDEAIARSKTEELKGIDNIIIARKTKPKDLPTDMWGLAAQLYNAGLRGVGLANELKRRGGEGWNYWYDTIKNLLT